MRQYTGISRGPGINYRILNRGGQLARALTLPGVVIVVLLAGLFSSDVYGEKDSSQQDVPYFSDKDVEQYKMPSDNKPPGTRVKDARTKEEKAAEKKEQREQEDWCKRATLLRKRIEKAQDAALEIEEELSAEKLSRKKRIPLEKKLKRARKQVSYAEKDLTDLENEAHRKDIPPGWLRCQFE